MADDDRPEDENDGAERRRALATGNPFDLSTDPTVPKLFSAIQASPTAGKLTATDRAVLDFLLAAAYPTLNEQSLHEVSVHDLNAVLGTKHESTDWIIASLSRLRSTQLNIPVEETLANGKKVERVIVANLINGSVPRRSGVVRYSFYEELRPMLADPAVYARIRLTVIAQFRCKYAAPLYEVFEGHANRKIPTWRTDVDDLRSFLAVGGQMSNWADFKRRVLDPALKEINELSGLTITMSVTKRVGKRVAGLAFRVDKKESREAIEAELRHKALLSASKAKKPPRTRDKQTLDLIDGKSDAERGGTLVLKAPTIDAARKRHPGYDIEHFERKWQEYQVGKAMPRDPDKAFLTWLDRAIALAAKQIED
jgi:hypothetical protein